MEPIQTTPAPKSQSGLIISVIVVLVIALVAFMLLGDKRMQNNMNDGMNNTETTGMENENAPVNGMSASDETSDIEADLNANSDIETIDSDFK